MKKAAQRRKKRARGGSKTAASEPAPRVVRPAAGLPPLKRRPVTPVTRMLREIGQEFQRRREQAGLRVSELAQMLNLAPATVVKFEDGRHSISLKNLLLLCEQLHCHLEVVDTNSDGRGKRRKK